MADATHADDTVILAAGTFPGNVSIQPQQELHRSGKLVRKMKN